MAELGYIEVPITLRVPVVAKATADSVQDAAVLRLDVSCDWGNCELDLTEALRRIGRKAAT